MSSLGMRLTECARQEICRKRLTIVKVCVGVPSDPFDPAQKTARSRRMDIDVIGATIGQSAIQQSLDIGAVAYVA